MTSQSVACYRDPTAFELVADASGPLCSTCMLLGSPRLCLQVKPAQQVTASATAFRPSAPVSLTVQPIRVATLHARHGIHIHHCSLGAILQLVLQMASSWGSRPQS